MICTSHTGDSIDKWVRIPHDAKHKSTCGKISVVSRRALYNHVTDIPSVKGCALNMVRNKMARLPKSASVAIMRCATHAHRHSICLSARIARCAICLNARIQQRAKQDPFSPHRELNDEDQVVQV